MLPSGVTSTLAALKPAFAKALIARVISAFLKEARLFLSDREVDFCPPEETTLIREGGEATSFDESRSCFLLFCLFMTNLCI